MYRASVRFSSTLVVIGSQYLLTFVSALSLVVIVARARAFREALPVGFGATELVYEGYYCAYDTDCSTLGGDAYCDQYEGVCVQQFSEASVLASLLDVLRWIGALAFGDLCGVAPCVSAYVLMLVAIGTVGNFRPRSRAGRP